MKWIAAAGLVLQFLSFWLAAPELLGIERLRQIEGRVRGLVSMLPALVYTLAGISMGIFGTWFGRRSSGDPAFLRDHPLAGPAYLIGLALVTVPLLLFQRRIVAALDRWLVAPLLRRLIADEGTRVRSLFAAAVLMTAGFLMQLVATIWP